MAEQIWLHDHYLNYDEADYVGIEYLRDQLSEEEVKVFFDQAYEHGKAEFEDNQEHNFSIVYEDGDYKLVSR